MNTYTPDFIANALAQHELNGGNVQYTASQLQIPRKTLAFWVKKAGVATLAVKTYDYAELWAAKERKALERLGELIPNASFRDLSIFAGIAADKHLDYSEGRKGATVNIDNRSVHIDTTEALQALRAAKMELLNDGQATL